MSTKDQVVVSDDTTSVGDVSVESKAKSEQVSRDAYDKLLAQRKKDQEKLKELESFKTDQEKRARELEEEKLAQQGNYKTILEQREKELNETRSKLSGLEKTLNDSVKLSAVLGKLNGKLASPAYASFIDLDQVAVDPETGSVDAGTVESVANKFLTEHPTLIISRNGVKLPTDSAKTTTETITYEQWLKLPAKEARAKQKFVK